MGGSQATVAEAADIKDAGIHPLLAYVRQLTPSARSHLLVELERLEMSGEGIPGSQVLLQQLRAEFRHHENSEKSHDRVKSPSRYFFQPVEAFLVNRRPERVHAGQIARGSLAPIWEMIGQMLLPAMTRDYEKELKMAILAQKSREIEEKAAHFQSQVLKSLEIKLGGPEGADRLRKELAKYTASRGACDDLIKLVRVLQSRDALAKFQAALPDQISAFEGGHVDRVRQLLNTCTETHAMALPFAATLVMKRLKQPWQLIRLAISMAGSRKITEIAATPASIVASIVLEHLEHRRGMLCQAMRENQLGVAEGMIAEIYNYEYALRLRIIMSDASDWGRRLDAIMQQVVTDVGTEACRIPDNLDHVLLAALRRHDSLSRRFMFSLLRARDAFYDHRMGDAAGYFARALYASWFRSAVAP